VATDDGVLVMTGSLPWLPRMTGPAGVVTVDFPGASCADRRRYWAGALSAHDMPAGEAAAEVLAARFRLTARQIDDAAAVAAETASVTGRPPALADLMAAARAQTGHDLAPVATRLPTRASWDDLVLPADVLVQLRELCDRVTSSESVLADWGFGARLPFGPGVAALFTGPPGTGKTTGAAIVAGQLGLDLYRIDLSRVVSKYVGDTEKNLDRVFTAARDASAVLLFDEADALFGKRSVVHDAHDRYANTEVAYLLQKMEEYEGIAILATNLQENLDDAFARRLTFTIGFPFPDEACRRRIWAGLWPPLTPLAADLDTDLLAGELTMSGGSIRNIGVAAAFLAAADGGKVTMAHVLQAARRECHKLGRTFPEGLACRVR
jgi:SpoVK/Ycf46/Vps4 family AAA+-type ATPase